MNSFLEKHLLLSNKNNILDIKIGRRKGDNIFDGNISETIIKNIIKNIKQYSQKIKISSYSKEIYIKNNEYFTLNKGELAYEIHKLKDFHIDKNYLIKNIEISRDEFIVPTYNSYHNIENIEILDIKVNNQIILSVKKLSDKHSLSIIINKPIKIEQLNEIIQIINRAL